MLDLQSRTVIKRKKERKNKKQHAITPFFARFGISGFPSGNGEEEVCDDSPHDRQSDEEVTTSALSLQKARFAAATEHGTPESVRNQILPPEDISGLHLFTQLTEIMRPIGAPLWCSLLTCLLHGSYGQGLGGLFKPGSAPNLGSLGSLGSLGKPGSLGSLGSALNPVNIGTQAWDKTLGKYTNLSSSEITKRISQNTIPGVKHRIITDVPFGGHKLAEVFQDQNDTVLNCNLLGDKALIEGALAVIPESLVTKVNEEEMQYFLDLCHNRDPNAKKSGLKSFFDFIGDIFKSLFIFPGTKWCGAGDVAKNYDDLGTSKATDACCREHDHSTDSIAALSEKYGLRNTNLYTMTNCKDDQRFYGCLLNDSSLPSAAVGKLFFNVLKTNCFANTYPKTCVKDNQFFIPLLTEKCKEYRLDTSQPKKWQTFSPPNFAKDYLARKRMQTNKVQPPNVAMTVPSQGAAGPPPPPPGASLPEPVTTEEPEEEPYEEEEPDNWNILSESDISLDATEEPVYEEGPTIAPMPRDQGSIFKPKNLLGGLG